MVSRRDSLSDGRRRAVCWSDICVVERVAIRYPYAQAPVEWLQVQDSARIQDQAQSRILVVYHETGLVAAWWGMAQMHAIKRVSEAQMPRARAPLPAGIGLSPAKHWSNFILSAVIYSDVMPSCRFRHAEINRTSCRIRREKDLLTFTFV